MAQNGLMDFPAKRSRFLFRLILIFLLAFLCENAFADGKFKTSDFYDAWKNLLELSPPSAELQDDGQRIQALKAFIAAVAEFKRTDSYAFEIDGSKSELAILVDKIDALSLQALDAAQNNDGVLYEKTFDSLSQSMTDFFILTIESDRLYILPFVELVALLSLLIVIAVFAIALYLQNKKKIDALAEKQRHEKLVTATIASVQENERSRISRDLHDTITQDIRTELLLLRSLEKSQGLSAEDFTSLKKIRGIGEANLRNIRNIIRNLTPPEIESADFVTLLSEFAQGITEFSCLECKFYAQSQELCKTLSEFQKLHIFRIVQEAVNNAVKHSGADEISIFVREEDSDPRKDANGNAKSKLVFLVSDDGCGMESQEEKPVSVIGGNEKGTHLGLRGMKSRAELLGADLIIKSSAEMGTQVKLIVNV